MKLQKLYHVIFDHKLLPIIIVFAFMIGLGNPFFDSPLAFTIGDEFEAQRVAFEILNSKNLKHFSVYLPGWAWIQLPFIGLSVLILRFFSYSSIQAIKNLIALSSPGYFLFVPRILSNLFSSLSLIWLYHIGKKLKSKKLGLILSFLYSLDFTRIHQAHFGRITSPYLFSIFAFLYFIILFHQKPQLKTFNLSLLFFILSISFFPAAISLIACYIVLFYFHLNFFSKNLNSIFTSFLLSISVLAFLIYLTPGTISYRVPEFSLSTANLSFLKKLLYYSKISFLVNPTIFIFGIISTPYFLKNSKTKLALLFSFIIPSALIFIIKDTAEPRYSLFITFYLALSLSYFLEKHFPKKPIWIVLFLATIYSLVINLKFNQLLFRPSTYITAKQYLENNTPGDQPILVDRNNFYLLPNQKAQFPKELYDNSFYQNLNQIVGNLSPIQRSNIKNIKSITSLSNYTMLASEKSWPMPKAEDYEYVVVEFFNQNEKQSYLQEINFNHSQFDLIKTINPTKSQTQEELYTVLNIENPISYLFAVSQFGPYFEIYEKK